MTHEERIDALIPEAEAAAEKIVQRIGQETVPVKGVDGQIYQWCFRTQFFHHEMNRLAREKGLR